MPAILLAVGSLFLPPSPRLLVAHGRHEEALQALAKLRRRADDEVHVDPLLQVNMVFSLHDFRVPDFAQIELIEMRTEVSLIERTTGSSVNGSGIASELRAWGLLFSKKYTRRTMIGVLMMFFQRKFIFPNSHFSLIYSTTYDPEWSGINALLYYGPTLMQELGLRGDTVTLLVSGGIGIVQFISVFPVILYIDRLGTWYVCSI